MIGPAEVSRRLKAARWLAGDIDEQGKPKALSTRDLAQREPLPSNGISANRIEEIEQLKLADGPRPMELEKIAQALGLPHEWFFADVATAASSAALRSAAELLGPLLLSAAQASRLEPEREQPDRVAPDRQGGSVEAGDG